jgi:hypothetical protein
LKFSVPRQVRRRCVSDARAPRAIALQIRQKEVTRPDVIAPEEPPSMIIGSRHCLFCIGRKGVERREAMREFASDFSAQRHTQKIHLRQLKKEKPFTCPIPFCRASVVNLDHFKNHTATVHWCFLGEGSWLGWPGAELDAILMERCSFEIIQLQFNLNSSIPSSAIPRSKQIFTTALDAFSQEHRPGSFSGTLTGSANSSGAYLDNIIRIFRNSEPR